VYLAFIALGLPDALLGSSWNLVREDLSMPLGAIGLVTFFSYILTMFATFSAPRVLSRVQTKQVTFVSILFTGSALLLMSQVTAFWQIVLLAIPLGMGAGAIDLSLNHYTAVHFKASHMNYLHSFYGLGVTFGPMVMAWTLQDESWRLGYQLVGFLLLGIALVVGLSHRAWDEETIEHRNEHHARIPIKEVLAQRGVLASLVIFLLYVHIESLLGVFVASFAFLRLGAGYAEAALFTMTYFLTLTIGRIASGLLSNRLHPNRLILVGEFGMVIGAVVLLIPGQALFHYHMGVALLGIGSGPVFPNMMYMNPHNFEKRTMSRVMSLQMMIGYIGFGILTPLMGQVFDWTTIAWYPFIALAWSVLLLVVTLRFFALKLSSQTKKAA
jgi:fucose permease